VSLGARRIGAGRGEVPWVVMAAPDDKRVLRPDSEIEAHLGMHRGSQEKRILDGPAAPAGASQRTPATTRGRYTAVIIPPARAACSNGCATRRAFNYITDSKRYAPVQYLRDRFGAGK
jgi:hypothetical protein